MDLWLEFDASSLAGSQPLTAPKTVPGLRSLGPFVGEDGHLRRQIMAAYDAEIRGEKNGDIYRHKNHLVGGFKHDFWWL